MEVDSKASQKSQIPQALLSPNLDLRLSGTSRRGREAQRKSWPVNGDNTAPIKARIRKTGVHVSKSVDSSACTQLPDAIDEVHPVGHAWQWYCPALEKEPGLHKDRASSAR